MQTPEAKLRCTRGETIVETLASVLIVALSCLIFFTMVMSSSRMNAAAIAADDAFYAQLTAAETHSGDGATFVTVSWGGGYSVFAVLTSGGEGELSSYRGGAAP